MCASVYIHGGRRIVGVQSLCFVGKLTCFIFFVVCSSRRIVKLYDGLVLWILWWQENAESFDYKEQKAIQAWYFDGLKEKLSVCFAKWSA